VRSPDGPTQTDPIGRGEALWFPPPKRRGPEFARHQLRPWAEEHPSAAVNLQTPSFWSSDSLAGLDCLSQTKLSVPFASRRTHQARSGPVPEAPSQERSCCTVHSHQNTESRYWPDPVFSVTIFTDNSMLFFSSAFRISSDFFWSFTTEFPNTAKLIALFIHLWPCQIR